MFLKYNIRCGISIHALREEGDISLTPDFTKCFYFNPRPPRGGRPADLLWAGALYSISIHALREEGDTQVVWWLHSDASFQSTPSARRATEELRANAGEFVFQSTPSARRATAKAAKKSTTFVPLYTLVHNLKRNFTKAPAK